MSGLKLVGCTAAALIAMGLPASAEVVRDGSLGTGTIGTVFDSVSMETTYVITEEHGKFAGNNLFHSFSDFSLTSSEIASFTLTSGCVDCTVNNIIAGVSGGRPSSIDGMIQTTEALAGASLFLLNPAGIFFGPDAELDVGGSFHASTADVLRFNESENYFDVLDASAGRILNSAQPSAFGFTGPVLPDGATSRLNVNFSNLEVNPGATLSLIGADDRFGPGVFILGTGPSRGITAPGATVQIAAVGRPGVDIDVVLTDLDMESLDPDDLGIVLVQKAGVIVGSRNIGMRAGTVVIRAGTFQMTEFAKINATNSITDDLLEQSERDALGPIDIAVTRNIVLEVGSVITSETFGVGAAPGTGASGDILLNARQEVSVTGGSRVESVKQNSFGEAGAIKIDADRIFIEDGEIKSESSVVGLGGAIFLNASGIEGITLSNDALVWSNVSRDGIGGPITLNADRIALEGGSVASETKGSGAGGRIVLNAGETGEITLTNGAHIDSVTSGTRFARGAPPKAGVGGDIDVYAQHLTISNQANHPNGTLIGTTTTASIDTIIEDGDGDGGNLNFDVGTLELLSGGQINTSTEGAAKSGDITMNATTLVSLVGESADGFSSIISSRARADATGPGGRIAITSPILEVRNGAQISSGTEGAGAAGAIEIYASDRFTIVGGANGVSVVEAASFVRLGGPSGTIRIEAGRLDLQEGGQITASTSGSHDAGSIEIEAAHVEISGAADSSGANQSGVFSKSLTFGIGDGGNGGDIVITGFKSIAVSDGGQISADTKGSGLGGSIEIRDGGSIQMDRGSISANASSSGNAGNIVIDVRGVFRMDDSAVTTKATQSSGGNIEITARDRVYLGSSQIETEVLAGAPGEAAGDVTVRSQIAALNRSHIIANAVGLDVDAGNIAITVDQFVPSGDSFLRATAETGISGTIDVSSPDSDLTGTLATLPDSFFDASSMMARNCAARTTRAGSFAVDTGGELPPPPGETLELDGAATGIAPTDEAEECRAVEDLS